jgi:hypothetical protein
VRSGVIAFGIEVSPSAVKDCVGAEMHEGRAYVSSDSCPAGGEGSIYLLCILGAGFALLMTGHRNTINNDVPRPGSKNVGHLCQGIDGVMA